MNSIVLFKKINYYFRFYNPPNIQYGYSQSFSFRLDSSVNFTKTTHLLIEHSKVRIILKSNVSKFSLN